MQIKRDGIEGSLGQYIQYLLIRTLLFILLALPYKTRLRFMGWIMVSVVAPISGYNKRIRNNLNHVRPDLDEDEVNAICKDVSNNVGRSLIEIFSGQEFIDHVKDTPLTGPGADRLIERRKNNLAVTLTTGHFGNYDVPRAVLFAQGMPLGSLYKPMKNPFYNRYYVAAISKIGQPMFQRDKRGLGKMLRHLKNGGMIGVLFDIHVRQSHPVLDFFGKPARTSVASAEMAIRYDAPMFPIFGIRKPDGVNFEIFVDEPIETTDPIQMTQEFNDRLEAVVRENMGQWFWVHRRWKPELLPPEYRD